MTDPESILGFSNAASGVGQSHPCAPARSRYPIAEVFEKRAPVSKGVADSYDAYLELDIRGAVRRVAGAISFGRIGRKG